MNHEFYIHECFNLAKRGLGTVTPNPLVGSVIVINDKIVGAGYHQKKGENHAEINAILDAKKNGVTDFKNATLYCNLEPCCHTNKLTPPCVTTLIKEKIKTVVICNLDPNPFVSGKGVAELKQNGVTVVTGILENEGLRLNEIFFTHITKKRPFVHLKWAQSLDGYIGNGTKTYLSCEESLKLVHEMRLACDAIMVGRETLNCDNPKLTIRMNTIKERAPKRIVIGSFSKMKKDAHLFQDEFKDQTIVVTREKMESSANVISLKQEDDLASLLTILYSKGITSILVEGGGQLLKSFIERKLIDRLSIFITPQFFQSGVSAISSPLAKNEILKFSNHEWLQVGVDMLFDCRVKSLNN